MPRTNCRSDPEQDFIAAGEEIQHISDPLPELKMLINSISAAKNNRTSQLFSIENAERIVAFYHSCFAAGSQNQNKLDFLYTEIKRERLSPEILCGYCRWLLFILAWQGWQVLPKSAKKMWTAWKTINTKGPEGTDSSLTAISSGHLCAAALFHN